MPTNDLDVIPLSAQRLTSISSDAPLRVLFSGCLLGQKTNWTGEDNRDILVTQLYECDLIQPISFCPEDQALGTPRPLTTLYKGNGQDFWESQAEVLDTTGRNVSAEIKSGTEAMLQFALKESVELAILMELSDSCGTQATLLGDPIDRAFQKGRGVASQRLHMEKIPILGHQDLDALNALLSFLDPEIKRETHLQNFNEGPFFQKF